MTNEREWVPVAVIWDEDLRRERWDTERRWADMDLDLSGEEFTLEDLEREIAHLSKRRRKKARGDAGERER